MCKTKNKYMASSVLILAGLLLMLGFVPSNQTSLEFISPISSQSNEHLILPFINPAYEASAVVGSLDFTDTIPVLPEQNNSALQINSNQATFFGISLNPKANFSLNEDLFFIEKIIPQSQLCLYSPSQKLVKAKAPSGSMLERSKRYNPLVEKYASQYGLSTDLVLAIMQVESGFNPNLVSSRQAHGLMQVVPGTAGKDVHKYFGKQGLPSTESLLDPSTNIKYGTAYLSLLSKYHFAEVLDPLAQEYCMIAAYNLGPNALLASFSSEPKKAIEMINALSPDELLSELQIRVKAKETRQFITKVINAKSQYDAG